jgi:hypothetical protein
MEAFAEVYNAMLVKPGARLLDKVAMAIDRKSDEEVGRWAWDFPGEVNFWGVLDPVRADF